jgi:hypothetical protein
MEAFLILLLALFSIWLAAKASSHGNDLKQIKMQIMPLQRTIQRLEERIAELKKEILAFQAGQTRGQTAPPAAAERPADEAAPPRASLIEPVLTARKQTVETAIPAAQPVPQTIRVPGVPASTPVPEPALRETRQAVASQHEAAPPARTPLAPQRPWKLPQFDWEGLIGVKLFSWIAGIALVVAAIFFLKYSIAQGWLQPPVQMTIGVLVGLALLIACELKAANKYRITANAMDASALAVLFATFYSAYALWHILSAGVSFLFLILVTVIAVLLSIRRDSLFIALLGLIGGFSAPALLSSGENHPITLFSYLLLLNVGLAWIAARKKWPLLSTLTLVLTTLYQWAWVGKFLTEGQLPLASGIFLIFPVVSFATLTFSRRQEDSGGRMSLYGKSASLNALLPLLFAAYLASVPGYGNHYGILFGFLFLLAAGLFAVAVARRQEILHLAGAISTLVVFAIWFGKSYDSSAWPAILALVALFVLFYLAAPLIVHRTSRKFTGPGNHAVFAAPLLFAAFAILVAIEPLCAAPALAFAVLFALLAAITAYAVFRQQGAIYYLGAFFTLAAEAVWSARCLTPERLFSGLSIYAIFGLFFIGVPVAARRLHKTLRPEIAAPLLVLASVALLMFVANGGVGIWGLALLLLILNLGLLFGESAVKFPWTTMTGIALSWGVLAHFWSRSTLEEILVPALFVVTGFAVLAIVGIIRLPRATAAADGIMVWSSVFLGLVGHLFLLVVASQRALAVPPQPLLSALFVLDLAVGLAVLVTRRIELLAGAMAASQLILMIWTDTAPEAPYPAAAIVAAGLLVMFCFIWTYLMGRMGVSSLPFAGTAAASIFLAQLVTILAAQQTGAPTLAFLIAAHLVFLAALLGRAWTHSWHFLAPLAVLPTAVAVSQWMEIHRGSEFYFSQLLFAGVIYIAFIAYPLLLGRRAGRSLAPYLGAALASLPFFFQARDTIMAAGKESIVGVLPLIQAALMAVLLLNLLRIEPRRERTLNRLALIAGAALAFITAAIPLQLEKQWITVAWALEGAALAWLFRKIPHRGLLLASAGLFVTVFARLAINIAQISNEPVSGLPIWNWYLYTYLIPALAMMLGGWQFSKTRDLSMEEVGLASKLLPTGGTILLFLLLNIEIADYYAVEGRITFRMSATLGQDLTYTLGWALFAVVLLSAGIAIRSQAARIAALGLLVVTILKCFLYDLSQLGGLYRVMSFVGLAICLALVALALQRFVLALRAGD